MLYTLILKSIYHFYNLLFSYFNMNSIFYILTLLHLYYFRLMHRWTRSKHVETVSKPISLYTPFIANLKYSWVTPPNTPESRDMQLRYNALLLQSSCESDSHLSGFDFELLQIRKYRKKTKEKGPVWPVFFI